LKAYEQESAIGKALWHQFTTVIILRKNMRQTNQSEEDVKLRTALENMRYKSCTPEDIAFLRTRIAGPDGKRPKLSEKRFRNVSIITALNAQKDLINELGCIDLLKRLVNNCHIFILMTNGLNMSILMKQERKTKKEKIEIHF
jgi:hypothetical protein